MQREQIEQAAEDMMQMALDNLERDGYVAFAAFLLSKQGITPILLERVDAKQKERLGEFLRALASTGAYDAIDRHRFGGVDARPVQGVAAAPSSRVGAPDSCGGRLRADGVTSR